MFVCPTSPYHGADAVDGMVLEAFDRAAPRGMGAFKVGGNYAPVWRHAARARELGFGITLHLDSATRTKVEEFSTSGFLGLRTARTARPCWSCPAPRTPSRAPPATPSCAWPSSMAGLSSGEEVRRRLETRVPSVLPAS